MILKSVGVPGKDASNGVPHLGVGKQRGENPSFLGCLFFGSGDSGDRGHRGDARVGAHAEWHFHGMVLSDFDENLHARFC